MRTRRAAGLLSGMLFGLSVVVARAQAPTDSDAFVHFVSNSQAFWDFSKNWSTNYGPNYRDTVEETANFPNWPRLMRGASWGTIWSGPALRSERRFAALSRSRRSSAVAAWNVPS